MYCFVDSLGSMSAHALASSKEVVVVGVAVGVAVASIVGIFLLMCAFNNNKLSMAGVPVPLGMMRV